MHRCVDGKPNLPILVDAPSKTMSSIESRLIEANRVLNLLNRVEELAEAYEKNDTKENLNAYYKAQAEYLNAIGVPLDETE
jgi:hypothetical protein